MADHAVSRVGETVKRPARASSASVQAVLLHLRRAGVTCVPEPLGFDELGREVVSYLAGDVWNDPLPDVVWRESTLVAAAELLRVLHDATLDFQPPAEACWMLSMPSDLPLEVVCHNDFAPYNAVFVDDRLAGVIDWETAVPGARVWDVAHTAYRFVPLSASAPPELRGTRVQARRLALFCDAYGLDSADRAILVATVARRATALQELVVTLAASGDPAGQARLGEGHADLYAADMRYLLAEEAALGAEL
jgi:aminoglycoside phosphotransferase (APT) family kinase protein